MIVGIAPADSGAITLDGQPVQIRSPQQAMRLGLAYVTEDRRQLGLTMSMSIATNISLPMLHEYVNGLGLIKQQAECQIETVTAATTQQVAAIMISNNTGDQIVPAAKAAQEAGLTVVTWDSPIPTGEGEDVFVAQVDFNEIGVVMADMTLSILGKAGKDNVEAAAK